MIRYGQKGWQTLGSESANAGPGILRMIREGLSLRTMNVIGFCGYSDSRYHLVQAMKP